MGRYMLFRFDDYYPSGGLNDLSRTSDNLQELLDMIPDPKKKEGLTNFEQFVVANEESENYQIFDRQTGEMIVDWSLSDHQ